MQKINLIINIGFNPAFSKFKFQLKSFHELWGHISIINNKITNFIPGQGFRQINFEIEAGYKIYLNLSASIMSRQWVVIDKKVGFDEIQI